MSSPSCLQSFQTFNFNTTVFDSILHCQNVLIMLVVGICNPAGESEDYNGLYLTQSELESAAAAMPGVPVKAEHAGTNIGSVVSAWIDDSQNLNCLVRLHNDSIPAYIAQGLVRDGIAADFSLGYTVDVKHSHNKTSSNEKWQAIHKKIMEVSLVRRGARRGCHIHAYADKNGCDVVLHTDPWFAFDLR